MRPLRFSAFSFTVAFAAALFIAAFSARPSFAQPGASGQVTQAFVSIGPGRRIHFVCAGQGQPTVILSAGGGSWSNDWIRLELVIARTTRVCAWDRAGNGFSSASAEPQDLIHTEADLEATLAAAKITGPLVLVGHSYGGLESLMFADRHPERTVGMVLVDPSFPDQTERLARAAPTLMAFSAAGDQRGFEPFRRCVEALSAGPTNPPPGACKALRARYPEGLRTELASLTGDPAYWRTFLSALDQRDLNAKQAINPKRDYHAMPLTVFGSGELSLPGAPVEVRGQIPAVQAELERAHRELAGLSTRGEYIRVPGAGHAIHLEKPDLVSEAILKVVDQARAAKAGS